MESQRVDVIELWLQGKEGGKRGRDEGAEERREREGGGRYMKTLIKDQANEVNGVFINVFIYFELEAK